MKNIQFSTLKGAVKGALRIYEQQKRLVLRRFTVKQEQFFIKTENYVNKPLKCKASTGMVIDFTSNTEHVEFSASTFVAATRTPCYFDVYCDDELVSHCGYNLKEDGFVSVKATLKKGEKRVKIYLPNMFEAQLHDFNIDDNATFTPYKNEKKWLFLGDSITQGYVAECPSKSYANQIARAFNCEALNHAIGGSYFLADDLDKSVNYNPNVISVAYGTNDWAHGYDILNNATQYFEKLTKIFPHSKIICITPIWRGDLEAKKQKAIMPFDMVGDLLEDVCKKFGVSVIRGENLVDKTPKNFIEDVLHPNDKGFDCYSKNLISAIKNINVL